MKRSLTVACMLASAIGVSSITFTHQAAAQAADTPSAPGVADAPTGPVGPSKVAVILFQQAVAQTNEGQRSIAQLRQKYEPKQTQLKTESDEIDSLKKQIQQAGTSLSDQERDARLKTIDEKTKDLQRNAEEAQNDFNSDMNDAFQSLAQKVYVVVDAYAKEKGYTIVLDAGNQQSSPVLWVNPVDDITKAVIAAYNAKSGVPAQSTGTTTPPKTGATHTTTHSTTSHSSTRAPQ